MKTKEEREPAWNVVEEEEEAGGLDKGGKEGG